MKTIKLLTAFVLLQSAPGQAQVSVTFTNAAGNVFRDARVVAVYSDSIFVAKGASASKVPMVDLPEEIRSKFQPLSDESQIAHIARLQQENEILKQEIARLRRMVPGNPAANQPAPSPRYNTPAPRQDTLPQAASHWLTTSSKKRHNSRCQYYRSSNGRPCGPNEGIACQICGG